MEVTRMKRPSNDWMATGRHQFGPESVDSRRCRLGIGSSPLLCHGRARNAGPGNISVDR